MNPFAGVIRLDSDCVASAWVEALESHFAASRCRIHRAPSESFFQGLYSEPDTGVSGSAIDGPIFMVDAILDNREDLGSQLGLPVPLPEAMTDASLVELSYAYWGERLVEHLIGEFAIAIWRPATRRLFMARDKLGAKALFYHASSSVFAFATDLPALLKLKVVPGALCEEQIFAMLCRESCGPLGATVYQGINRVPSAHVLELENGQLSNAPYWVPSASPPATQASDEAYAEGLRHRIVTAVEQQMHGGRKIAVHLSGGLDSAAIACIAARKLKQEGRRLIALCSVLPGNYSGPETDERHFIKAVLDQEDNIDAIWLEPPRDVDPFGACPRWFAVHGQPSYSNVSHIEELLGEAGQKVGVDCVLNGFGGDFFASAPVHNIPFLLLCAGAWGTAFKEILALRRVQGLSLRRLLRQEFLAPLLRPALHRLRRHEARGAAHPAFVQQVVDQRARSGLPSKRPALPRAVRDWMPFLLAPGHLEVPVNCIKQVFAREFSQNLRFPLLDMRVIEYTLTVPIEQFARGGWTRSIMRRAMVGILPELIRTRRDKGGAFDPAITSRFVHHRTSLVEWAERTKEHRCWTYIDRDRFLEVLDSLTAGPRAQWRQDFFRVVIEGGWMAHFIQLHDQAMDR